MQGVPWKPVFPLPTGPVYPNVPQPLYFPSYTTMTDHTEANLGREALFYWWAYRGAVQCHVLWRVIVVLGSDLLPQSVLGALRLDLSFHKSRLWVLRKLGVEGLMPLWVSLLQASLDFQLQSAFEPELMGEISSRSGFAIKPTARRKSNTECAKGKNRKDLYK